MTSLIWPQTIRPVEIMFAPEFASRSGGVSITGYEQIVASSAGRWRAKLSYNIGRGVPGGRRYDRPQDMILAWRAVLAHLEGRTNTILIGPNDMPNAPGAVSGGVFGPFNLPHGDGSLFSDYSGYDQYATPAHAYGGASIGATSLTVVMEAGHNPEPGQYFGVGERLYLIKTATETSTPDRWALTFWPTLRAAVAGDEVVNFDTPVCKMRLASDGAADLSLRGPAYRATPSIELVEAN